MTTTSRSSHCDDHNVKIYTTTLIKLSIVLTVLSKIWQVRQSVLCYASLLPSPILLTHSMFFALTCCVYLQEVAGTQQSHCWVCAVTGSSLTKLQVMETYHSYPA